MAVHTATLKSSFTVSKSKAVAGSALSQAKVPKKTTSATAVPSAVKMLSDSITIKASKSAAGSALAQKVWGDYMRHLFITYSYLFLTSSTFLP